MECGVLYDRRRVRFPRGALPKACIHLGLYRIMRKKITAKYNEYGYVIYIDGKAVYTAGNHPTESQGYLGVEVSINGGYARKKPKNTLKDALDLNEIRNLCSSMILDVVRSPQCYSFFEYYTDLFNQGATYSAPLNPRQIALDLGVMPVEHTKQPSGNYISREYKDNFKAY